MEHLPLACGIPHVSCQSSVLSFHGHYRFLASFSSCFPYLGRASMWHNSPNSQLLLPQVSPMLLAAMHSPRTPPPPPPPPKVGALHPASVSCPLALYSHLHSLQYLGGLLSLPIAQPTPSSS
ncbi:hypothetical protein GOP47_0026969 [Adiantum capillus-veneris]|nr:hypothetical protein GOP47_0026969 [Adiantum capillus-veneris]